MAGADIAPLGGRIPGLAGGFMVPGAGIDSFAGSETGCAKRARRVRAREGANQPHGNRAGSACKKYDA